MRYTIVVEYLTTKGRTRCEEIECDFDLMDEENPISVFNFIYSAIKVNKLPEFSVLLSVEKIDNGEEL